MQRLLFIVNEAPYGSELPYNALRLARSAGKAGASVKVFLMGDAAIGAIERQETPDGFYKLDRMLRGVVRQGAVIGVCGTCLDARGIAGMKLVDGAHRSSMEELAGWTLEADKVIVF